MVEWVSHPKSKPLGRKRLWEHTWSCKTCGRSGKNYTSATCGTSRNNRHKDCPEPIKCLKRRIESKPTNPNSKYRTRRKH